MTTRLGSPFLCALGAAILVVTSAGITPAAAQYRDDDSENGYSDDRNGAYEDSGYQSQSRGGYSKDDDEDGYEDGQDAPDVAYFYDELEDAGTWENDPEYGQVWSPRNVDADWRPYTRGTWANTEEHGWYWVSDEPFGWATYHYGRWHLSDRRGWVWVPGTRWGPAWVAWRSNDDQIGWAPLPPDSYWEHGHGLHVSETIYEGPRFSAYWSFVEPRYITAPRLYSYCAPRSRVVSYIGLTRPQTHYSFVNRRIVNRGVSVTTIERVTRTRITTVRVNASDNRAYRTVRRDDRTINIFRPRLTRTAVRPRPQGRPVVDHTQFRDVDRRPPPRRVRPANIPRATTSSPIDDLARQQAAPNRDVIPRNDPRPLTRVPANRLPDRAAVPDRDRELNRALAPVPDRTIDRDRAVARQRAVARARANAVPRQPNNPYAARPRPNQGGQQQFGAETFKQPVQRVPTRAENLRKQRAAQQKKEKIEE